MTEVISSIETRRIRAPLARPWGPDVPDISLIVVDVTDSAGNRGQGFSWTPSIGAPAVQAMIDHDIRPFALGSPADARTLWPSLWSHLHEAGGGGVTTIAMAGLDIALWDLAGRRDDQSIVEAIGQRQGTAEVYGSGVNLHYSLDDLRAQAERWVAAGYRSVKMKVGKPDLSEDIDRVAMVRDVIGPARRLMIDANQRWSVLQALRSIDALSAFDLAWIEEPLRADDLLGYRELRRNISVPAALGENLHTIFRFAEFIELEAVDVIQPNVVRVGGITPFLQIAALATGETSVAPHLLFELSGQLALTLPHPTLVEEVEDAGFADLGILETPAPVSRRADRLTFAPLPGTGLTFRTDGGTAS